MANIYEVAELAGVSLATVSRVINPGARVSDKTRQKVLAAMQQLGYQPNAIAQALATRSSNAVGVLVSELHGPFFGAMLSAIEKTLKAAGKFVLVAAGHNCEQQEREAVRFLVSRNCDALIVHAGLVPGRPTLLVVGGSQGARGLNSRVLAGVQASADLPFQLLHCAGPADAARVRDLYRDLPVSSAGVDFLPDIGRAYAVADLVLARAGASTVAECLALAKPAVFVPYPWHKDRQQARNAEAAVGAGAARMVPEEALTPAVFRGLVQDLLVDGAERERMRARAARHARPDAARAMAAHLIESLGEAVGESPWHVEIGG